MLDQLATMYRVEGYHTEKLNFNIWLNHQKRFGDNEEGRHSWPLHISRIWKRGGGRGGGKRTGKRGGG